MSNANTNTLLEPDTAVTGACQGEAEPQASDILYGSFRSQHSGAPAKVASAYKRDIAREAERHPERDPKIAEAAREYLARQESWPHTLKKQRRSAEHVARMFGQKPTLVKRAARNIKAKEAGQ